MRHLIGGAGPSMMTPVLWSRLGGNGFFTTHMSGELCGLFEGTTIPASSHCRICFRIMGRASGGIGLSLCVIGPPPGLSCNSSQSSPRQVGGKMGSQLKSFSPSITMLIRSSLSLSLKERKSDDAMYPRVYSLD